MGTLQKYMGCSFILYTVTQVIVSKQKESGMWLQHAPPDKPTYVTTEGRIYSQANSTYVATHVHVIWLLSSNSQYPSPSSSLLLPNTP